MNLSPQLPCQILNSAEKAIWFRNAACVVTLDVDGSQIEDWSQSSVLGIRRNVDLFAIGNKIVYLGSPTDSGIQDKFGADLRKGAIEVDAKNLVIMPGLVDAHTHPVFFGSRAKETVQKASGLTYEEIAKAGGGIGLTSATTRAANDDELAGQLIRHWQFALQRGVVLMESKTGYGLSIEEEIRHIKALTGSILTTKYGILPHVAPTLLGPHALSPDHTSLDSYLQALVDALPQFKASAIPSNRCLPLAADIFIERDYFSKDHGEKWLGSALQLGLDVHVHGDEFSRSGGSELAVALAMQKEQSAEHRPQIGRVLSVDHCQYSSEMDLAKFRKFGIAAVALPATSFFSNIPYVDANKWRSAGVRTAIASDYNPGSAPVNNLWFAAYLALSKCGFSMPEVLAGVTLNAAYALGAEDCFGSIKLGSHDHIIAFDGQNPEDFFQNPLGDHLRYVVTH